MLKVFGVVTFSTAISAFSIPGLVPTTYVAGDVIDIQVSKHLTNYGRH